MMNNGIPTMGDIYGGGSHIVKFGSPTCAPCKKMSPIFDELSKDKRFTDIGFWDVDISNPDSGTIVQAMMVRTAPTVICVKNGQNIKILMGGNQSSKESLVNALYEIEDSKE
jgi:thioredoxin 1